MENTESRFLHKAKRTDNNEWIQGYLFKTGERYKILPTDFVSPALSVQEDIICQCTGMEDNNYKLIFTNDIVEFQHKKNDKNPARYLFGGIRKLALCLQLMQISVNIMDMII